MEKNIMERAGSVLQCLELSPHRVPGFDSRPGPLCAEFACSPCVWFSFQVPKPTPSVQRCMQGSLGL